MPMKTPVPKKLDNHRSQPTHDMRTTSLAVVIMGSQMIFCIHISQSARKTKRHVENSCLLRVLKNGHGLDFRLNSLCLSLT